MKSLVIYYSLDGNTKLIAHTIAQGTGADLAEIKTKGNIPTSGFKKILFCFFAVLKRGRIKISALKKDPQNYDLIFIGGPVWAALFASPVLAFAKASNLEGKHVALFYTSGSGDAAKAFTIIGKSLKKCKIVGKIGFKEPLKNSRDRAIKSAKKWASEIIGKQI